MSISRNNGIRVASSLPSSLIFQASCSSFSNHQQRRWRSIGSAIHQGLHRDSGRRDGPRVDRFRADREDRPRRLAALGRPSRPRWEEDQEPSEELGFSTRNGTSKSRATTGRILSRGGQDAGMISNRSPRGSQSQIRDTKYPLSVPHTTAASEFIYGYGSVYAALRAGRRTCYKLYLHSRGVTRDEAAKEHASVRSIAVKSNIKIIEGNAIDVRLLDKMSNGRPHNGIVLEASPLPISSLRSLATVDPTTDSTFITIRNDGARLPFTSHSTHPVVLVLDDVLDAGNLGAILRSAYFLGIDAAILTGHCAPLNAVTLKASAGAAEALPLFKSENPALLLEQSKKAGWHVLSVTTPQQDRRRAVHGTPLTVPARNVRYHMASVKDVSGIDAKLSGTPQLIVVGGEGRGLRKFLTDKSDSFLEILAARDTTLVGLDSLNVSIAAAMACTEVLTRMRAGEEQRVGKEEKNAVDEGNGTERTETDFLALESDLSRREEGKSVPNSTS